MNKTIGILLMAYGTPRSLDEVETYYTHIRRGNKPPQPLLDELIGRYKAIGGVSPLNEITDEQARKLEQTLNVKDSRYKVYIGMKHAAPFIADAVRRMAADGIEEAVGIVLAPHYSTMSVGVYTKEALEAAEEALMKLHCVSSWHMEDAFLDALEERLREALEKFSEEERCQLKVVFSAHSLPERILALGDPYPEQLLETSRALASRLLIDDWQFAWQSAGRTAEPWLGPDLLVVMGELAEKGYRAMLSCPIGFVADHLEVLYDLDIEAQQHASQKGIHFERTASLNADQRMIDALVAAIHRVEREINPSGAR